MSTGEKKAYPLRISAHVLDAMQKWSEDELRSLNAQIEYVLREALRRAGRLKPDAGQARDGQRHTTLGVQGCQDQDRFPWHEDGIGRRADERTGPQWLGIGECDPAVWRGRPHAVFQTPCVT